MKKLIHKILKCRKVAVTTIFAQPVITYEWVVFGKFVIGRTINNA